MYQVPDPSWKINPDIVANESYWEVYGEEEEEEEDE